MASRRGDRKELHVSMENRPVEPSVAKLREQPAAERPRAIAIPLQCREAAVEPDSLSEEKRTADLIFSTGAGVRRYDYWSGEEYIEELSMEKGAVRLDRMNGGAPLLNTHGRWYLEDQIGVVVEGTAKVDGSLGRATVRFSKRETVEPIWGDVRDRIIRNVSVGYVVHKYEVDRSDDKLPTYRAIDWEPMEVSLVPIGADPGAGVTGAREAMRSFPCEIDFRADAAREEGPMKETTGAAADAAATKKREEDEEAAAAAKKAEEDAAAVKKAEEDAAAAAAAKEPEVPAEGATAAASVAARTEGENLERARVVAVQKAVGVAERGHPQHSKALRGLGEQLVAEGKTIEQAREAILDHLAAEGDKVTQRGTGGISVTRDETETYREGAVEALLHRGLPQRYKVTEKGRQFFGMRLMDFAKDAVERRGDTWRGCSPDEIVRRSLHSTSDLANILADVANKSLRNGYEESPRTFLTWCSRGTAPDFKNIHRTQLSATPALKEVGESGEIESGSMSDGKETYFLVTWARIVGITRKAIINDDMNALVRVPSQFGMSAARKESDVVYAVLTANAAMADTVALFHATHKNLGSGVIALAGLNAARSAFRLQTGLQGEILNLVMKHIIVPSALETVAQQFLAPLTMVAATHAETNPFRGSLQIVTEPRLDAASALIWFGAADPSQVDTIEYSYLEGQEGPFSEVRTGFDVDGVEYKIRHDFAAKALDHRGLYKSTGA